MQLPIDIKAVLDAALGIGEDACDPVAVGVIVDPTAPADLVAHVRAAFASAASHVRVTIGYLDDGACVLPTDDIAVIVGGVDERVGQCAAEARAAGVPTMVATTLPTLVDAIARSSSSPIPAGDIVAPAVAGSGAPMRASEVTCGLRSLAWRLAGGVAPTDAPAASFDAEPYVLDDESVLSLDVRMGEWIIETRRDKCIAMALAFPFVRRPLALETVSATAAQNAAIGVVPFIPGTDMPIMTLNQAKMVLKVAASYGQEMDASRVKEIAVVVASAFGWRLLARSVSGAVPALGWVVRGGVAYSGTITLGCAAIEYFEGGGGLVGLAEALSRAGDTLRDSAQGVATAIAERG